MITGSIPIPADHIIVFLGMQQPNPAYYLWVHIDQLVRAWLFVTISKDTLVEVRDLHHYLDIWRCLESGFNIGSLPCALDLKNMLTHLNGEDYQSINEYLCAIKSIADSLAAMQSLVSDLESIQVNIAGLPSDYDTFVNTFFLLPRHVTFDDLHSELLSNDNGI